VADPSTAAQWSRAMRQEIWPHSGFGGWAPELWPAGNAEDERSRDHHPRYRRGGLHRHDTVIVATDKNLGAGYTYPAIVENSILKR
jgi:hypothetical protein